MMMQKKYSLYLFKSLIYPFFITTFILTGVVWITQSIKIVHLIIKKGVGFIDFFTISIMMLPHLLFIIIPISMFCSLMYLVNKLMHNKEIIIFKSSGLSDIKIALPFIYFSVIVSLLCYIIAFYLLPVSHHKFKTLQSYFKEQYAALLIQEDVFTTQAKDITVYVNKKEGDLMKGLFVYDTRHKNKQILINAEEGKLIHGAVPKLELYNGTHQEKNLLTNKLSVLHFSQYIVNIIQTTQQEKRTNRTPDELYISEIFSNKYLSHAYANKFLANAHYRITWPLYVISLTIVALSILLSATYNRSNNFNVNCKVVVIGVFILILALMTRNITIHKSSYSFLMYLNALIPIFLGFKCLRGSK